MFGKTIIGSTCGCGCAGYVQLRRIIANLTGQAGITPSFSDQANMRSWVNSNFPPAGCGFAPNPSAWEWDYGVVFDTPSDTTPDPAHTSPCGTGSIVPSPGLTWVDSSTSFTGGSVGNGSFVTRASLLLPYSTAYLTATWCEGHSTAYNQKSCIMSGVPTDLGFVYDIPIPLVEIGEDLTCDDASAARFPAYTPVPPTGTKSDPGMYAFGNFDWSDILADIAANPTHYASGFGSPSACLSPDPFYGSTPP